MPVDRRRVGPLGAPDQVRSAWRHRGKEAESAVHVYPAIVFAGRVDHGFDRVELAAVHLAGIDDHQRRLAIQRVEPASKPVEVEPPDPVPGKGLYVAAADTLRGQHLERARVHEPGRQHRHLRQAREPDLGDIHALLFAPPLPRRGQADEVRHRGAGHHHARPARGQAQELLQPVERLSLHLDADRRENPGVGDGVIGGGQQVRGMSGRRVAANDEVIAARSGRVTAGLVVQANEFLDGGLCAVAFLGQRPVKIGERGFRVLAERRTIVGGLDDFRDGLAQSVDHGVDLAAEPIANTACRHKASQCDDEVAGQYRPRIGEAFSAVRVQHPGYM